VLAETDGAFEGVITHEKIGANGFGYDPIFIPEGHEKTLGELEETVKADISHRAKAIALARPLIELFRRRGT